MPLCAQWIRRLLMLVMIFTGMIAIAGTQPPLATFAARDYFGIAWPTTLVTYPLHFAPGQARPGRLRLIDSEGQEQPFQLAQVSTHRNGTLAAARLSFFTALAQNGSYHYSLLAETPTLALPPIGVKNEGTLLTLDNGVVAVRLPKPGTVTFPAPLSFGSDSAALMAAYGKQQESGMAPGPLQGMRLANGQWVGGSHFWAKDPRRAPKVLGYTCTLTEQGPLFAEARIRYAFDAGRFYQCAIRVLKNDPAVRIDEKFDLHAYGATTDQQVVFTLAGGADPQSWMPDHALWWKTTHWATLRSDNSEIAPLLKPFQITHGGANAGWYRLGKDARTLGVESWAPWGAYAAYVALVNSATLTTTPTEGTEADPARKDDIVLAANPETIPGVALVPLHAGTWRGDGPWGNKYLQYDTGKAVAMHWPLNVDAPPTEMTHTGEYDPALPTTYGRRLWALVGGSFVAGYRSLYRMRNDEGDINLDDYKNWVLDWPADPTVTYPRLAFTKAELAPIVARLDLHPLKAEIGNLLYFKDAAERFNERWQRLNGPYDYNGPRSFIKESVLGGYWRAFHQADSVGSWIGSIDELLSSPRLTEAQRLQLRREVALLASIYAEPDFNPRGSMVHLGNPNMPMCRFLGLPLLAALIPDHPQAKEWMKVSAEYVRYLNARNIAPGGAWSELVTYHGAGAPWLVRAAAVLQDAGALDTATATQSTLPYRFLLNLMSPVDPRFKARMLPAWGHEGSNASENGWLGAVMATRKCDPESSRAFLWGWSQLGRYVEQDFDQHALVLTDALHDLPANYVPPALESSWLPGMGATMRAHAGDPLETFLAYRQGYMISHCDENQGDFVLSAKGAPLVAMSIFAYPLHQHDPYIKLHHEFGWYSQLRVGSQSRGLGGWNPSSAVHAYAFSPSVDYLRGASNYDGNAWWTRQILFLKGQAAGGPNYFLFRDSTHDGNADMLTAKPRWWQLRTWGEKSRVEMTGDGLNYASEFGPKLAVRFLQPATVAGETHDASRTEWLYGSAGQNWIRAGSPTLEKGWRAKITETLSVSSFGPITPEQDMLTLLYPQQPIEALPAYERLADGVVKLTTSEGIDYAFLSRRPIEYHQGEVAFSGIAGAIRVYPNEVHLVIAEGPGAVTYHGVTLQSQTPVTKVIPLQGWNAQTITIPAAPALITFALNPKQGAIETLQPGVQKQTLAHGVAYAFAGETSFTFARDGVTFTGRRGGIIVDKKTQTTRLVMLDGQAIGYEKAKVWGCDGPYDITYAGDHLFARHAGLGRFLQCAKPAGIDRIPMMLLDGTPYMPGQSGQTIILPLMPGEHRIELRNLPQPTVFREARAW